MGYTEGLFRIIVKIISKIKQKGIRASFKYLKKFFVRRYFYLIAKLKRYPEYKNPTEDDLKLIERTLISDGISIVDYWVNIEDFDAFNSEFQFGNQFYGGTGSLFKEKMLEHYIAYDLGLRRLPKGSRYVDIAACNSPWVKLLREKGYQADAIDILPSTLYAGLPYYLVMDATKTNFEEESIDLASLQCAFEMFIHDDDSKLIDELNRILTPGGKAIICPLYMHKEYCGYCSPEYYNRDDLKDLKAILYVSLKAFGIPFSRKYDDKALQERVLTRVINHNMYFQLYALRNGHEIDHQIYCHFILELGKKE